MNLPIDHLLEIKQKTEIKEQKHKEKELLVSEKEEQKKQKEGQKIGPISQNFWKPNNNQGKEPKSKTYYLGPVIFLSNTEKELPKKFLNRMPLTLKWGHFPWSKQRKQLLLWITL